MNHQKWEIKHTDFSLVCAKPCKKSWLSCWPNADVVKIPRKIQQHRPWYKGGRSKGYLMHAIGTELNSLFLTILLYFYFLFFLFQIYFSASGQTYCLSTLCMQSGEKRKIELFANITIDVKLETIYQYLPHELQLSSHQKCDIFFNHMHAFLLEVEAERKYVREKLWVKFNIFL